MEQSSSGTDEIGFVEIWSAVRGGKVFILLCTVASTMAALIYVYLAPTVYKTEAILLPPLQGDIERMNVIPLLYEIKLADVYKNTVINLRSNSLRREFYLKNNLYDHLKNKEKGEIPEEEVFQEGFNKLFEVEESEVKGEDLPVVTITLEGRKPEQVANWLNDYIALVDRYTVNSIIKNIETRISVETSNIQNEINWRVKTAEKERLDEIARNEEAAEIAKKLGLENQADVPYYSYNQAIQAGAEQDVVVSQQSTPGYLKGYKALEAEAEVLRKRKNEESFIPELRKLQEKIYYYESILSKLEAGHSLRVDQQAMVPSKPFKPKKTLLVGLGFLVGLFAAIALVVMRSMFLDAGGNSAGRA